MDINNLPERFVKKIAMDEETGCWVWQGCLSDNGYARASYKGKTQSLHRLVYTLLVGEIPKGLMACHKCDVRACCNPDHIFIGTQSENMKDMYRKGRFNRTKYPL